MHPSDLVTTSRQTLRPQPSCRFRSTPDTNYAAYRDLPPGERAQAVFFAGNYGEAAALDIYGPALDGPPAISGHNSYFLWGPRGASGDVVVVLGRDPDRFRRVYDDIRAVGRVENDYAMPYENGLTIWVLRRPRAPLATFWPLLKHFD